MVGKSGRKGILEHAERLFRDYGYKPVSLADIANAVGIRKPSIYHHFPAGKEQLFVEVQIAVLERARARVNTAIAEAGEMLTDQLRAAIYALVAGEPIFLLSMMHHDMPELTEEHRQELSDVSYSAVMIPIVEIVDQAIARGEARRLNSHAVAGSIIAMIEGNTVAHIAGYGGEKLSTMVDHSIDLVLNGLILREDDAR